MPDERRVTAPRLDKGRIAHALIAFALGVVLYVCYEQVMIRVLWYRTLREGPRVCFVDSFLTGNMVKMAFIGKSAIDFLHSEARNDTYGGSYAVFTLGAIGSEGGGVLMPWGHKVGSYCRDALLTLLSEMKEEKKIKEIRESLRQLPMGH